MRWWIMIPLTIASMTMCAALMRASSLSSRAEEIVARGLKSPNHDLAQ